MGFLPAAISVLSKYATFSGRARRSEYWWFTLFAVLVALAAIVLDAVLGTDPLLYALALLLPSIAVNTRRLHDIGRSGWSQLLYIIPLVGTVLLIVWSVRDSMWDNEYGPSPKYDKVA